MHWQKPVADQLAGIDLHNNRVSPADILATLQHSAPGARKLKSIELQTFYDRLIYAVRDDTGQLHLFDAASGKPYSLSADTADAIVRQTFKVSGKLAEISTVNEHSYEYPWGELPVFRLKYDDSSSVSYYASPSSGEVMKTNWLIRVGSLSMAVHDFGPVFTLTGSDKLRMLLIGLIGSAALVGAVTGLYLTLPRRRRASR
jgi:hypothetical protein